MSSNYTDYYFQITKDEAAKNINNGNEYKAKDSFNFEADVRSGISLSKNFKLLLTADYTRYGKGVADSQ